MPYKDIERQRAYNRDWLRRNPEAAARTPLARRVEGVIAASNDPVSPAFIMDAINHATTRGTLNVTLARLRRAGKIKSLGYGQWTPA